MAKQTFKTPLNFQQVNAGSLEDKVLMRTADGDIKELPSDSFGSASGEFTLTGQGVTSTGANSANMQIHNVFGSGAYLKSSGNNTIPATAGYLSDGTNVVNSARPIAIDSQAAGVMGLKFNKVDFSPNIEKWFFTNVDSVGTYVKPAVLTTSTAIWMLAFIWYNSERYVEISEKQSFSGGTMSWKAPTGGTQGIPVLYNTSIGLVFYKDSSVINKIASFRTSSATGLTPYPDLAIPDGLFATHAFLGADNNVYFGATNSDYSINRIYKLLATNDTISLVTDLGASPVPGQPLIGNLFTSAARLYMFSDHAGQTKRITYAGVGTPFNSPVPLGREFVNFGTVYALAKDEVNNTGIYVLELTSGDATPINLTGVPSANSNWRSLGISAIGFDGTSLLICPKTTGTTPQYGIHKFTSAYAFEGEIKQEFGNTLMFWNDNYHGCVGSVGAYRYIRYYPKFVGNLLAFDKDGNVIKNPEDISQYWVQRNDIMYVKPAQYAYDFFLAMDTNSKIYKVPATEYNRAVIVQTTSYIVPTTQNSMSFVFNTVANCSVIFDNTPTFFRGRRMTFINRMTGNVTITRNNAIDINGVLGSSCIVPPNRTGVLECIGNIFYFSLLATS